MNILRKSLDLTAKIVATGFGLGYSPLISGTIGSLLGFPIYFLLRGQSPFTQIISIMALCAIGVVTAGRAEKLSAPSLGKDPGHIVIDEVAGCVIYLSLIPFEKEAVIAGFVVYRIFDIIKPFPAYRSQKLPGGWGIMADDIIAGIYAAMVINAGLWIKNFIY